MATGDGGRMPGIGGVLATAAIAARFGAEFLGAMGLTPPLNFVNVDVGGIIVDVSVLFS